MHSIVSECILRAATHATLDFQNCKIIVVRNLAQRNDYLDASQQRQLALKIVPARGDLFA
jgi:hypothetical protein